MFASVTRLRVRSLLFLPQFLWMTTQIQRQTEKAPGLLGLRLLVDRKQTYWTLTAWQDEKAMKAFRGSGPHAKAMKKLPVWCDEAAYAHWTEEQGHLPEWPEAYERLLATYKLSRVKHPSAAHERAEFRPPTLKSRFHRDLVR